MPMLQKVTSNKANVMDDSHPKQSIDKQPHESTSKETKSAKKNFPNTRFVKSTGILFGSKLFGEMDAI